MRNHSTRTTIAILLTTVLAAAGLAASQAAAQTAVQAAEQEWEYLIVSYGETRFANPFLDPDSSNASFSKVQLFSDLGVTLPSEAITLQRNVDILGRFGWELITVVGTIGGDQQLVFKRPYDEQRSAEEAARIQAEREELIAAYNESRTETAPRVEQERPRLVDLDAAERAQAINDRNVRDANNVRAVIERAAQSGFPLPELSIEGRAFSPDSSPSVTVRVTQDVTSEALVGAGQYRKSLVDEAVDAFREALVGAGFVVPPSSAGLCYGSAPRGSVTVTIKTVINHDGVTSDVGSYRTDYCFGD